MRLRCLLLPLAFALMSLASGCHHRHCCCGGCVAPCAAPCGTCCGYTPPAGEGPMPPLAPTAVVPHAPLVGAR